MPKTKFLKGLCQHCSGHLEFSAEMAGLTAPCPHCGEQTELLLARPPEEPTIPRRTIVWTLIGISILCLGFLGALAALQRAQRLAARQKHQTEAVLTADTQTNAGPTGANLSEGVSEENGFVVGPIVLETTSGTSRVYAVGTLKNKTDRKRFGVKLELDLADAGGAKLGTATDYKAVIEPGAEWQFKALVLDSKASLARLGSIKEDQ